jgi:hypothetical protein
MAIRALTAACLAPAAAGAEADLRPCAAGARCGSVTVPLVASDPASGNVSVGFEVYAHRRGARARDTVLVSAGSDGVPTTAGRAAVLALLELLLDRRDIVLVDARGTGRSGRVGDRTEAYGAGAAAEDRTPSAALASAHVGWRRGRRSAHRARYAAVRRPDPRARAGWRSRSRLQWQRARRGARARESARHDGP